MDISVVIPTKNRLSSVIGNLGNWIIQPNIREIIVVDNSEKPYSDDGLFVMFQEAFNMVGKRLIVVRERSIYSPVYLRWIGAKIASGKYLICWDDDNLLVTQTNTLIEDIGEAGQLGFCCLDAVNYCNFPDWVLGEIDPDDSDTMKKIYHPSVMQFHWFKSDKYSGFITPWGTGGLFMVNREEWLNNLFEEELRAWPANRSCEDVNFNVLYLSRINKQAVVKFHNKTVHLRHPDQFRVWEWNETVALKNAELLDSLEKQYIKGNIQWIK